MKSAERSQTFLRKRKMMLVLPLLVIPFLTMAFWAMGGGKGNQHLTGSDKVPGLNLNLPDAQLKEDKLLDKLSFYDKADKDSIKMGEWIRSDPYYKQKGNNQHDEPNELEQLTQTTGSKFSQRLNTSPYEATTENPEQRIIQKLALLENELNKSPEATNSVVTDEMGKVSNPDLTGEVDRLESMMGMMNKGNGDDPEIKQLENTLDKILDIQHPERVKDRIQERSLQNKETVYAVSKQADDDTLVNGFYGLENSAMNTDDPNAIEAVVHENQTLVNGAVIKMRLINDIYINGIMIPNGNFVFGIASLNDERLEIEINSIRSGNSLYNVKLQVYDMDGLHGIYIPGAISRDVAKQSADNSLQLMELSSMDPSLKAQATAAGIGAAKNLLSKKVKQVKVFVKAGYKVLLKDKTSP